MKKSTNYYYLFLIIIITYFLINIVFFVYFTLYLDAEYALCAPLFLLVALMTESWFYRHFGYFRKKWVNLTSNNKLEIRNNNYFNGNL